MKQTLHTAVEAYMEVLDWMEEHEDELVAAGGELPPELERLMEEAERGVEDRLEARALVIEHLTALHKVAKDERQRLQSIEDSYANRLTWLKRDTLERMQYSGVKRIEAPRAKMRVQKNTQPSVRAANEARPPEEFCRLHVQAMAGAPAEALREALASIEPSAASGITAQYAFDAARAKEHVQALGLWPKEAGDVIEVDGIRVVLGSHLRIW